MDLRGKIIIFTILAFSSILLMSYSIASYMVGSSEARIARELSNVAELEQNISLLKSDISSIMRLLEARATEKEPNTSENPQSDVNATLNYQLALLMDIYSRLNATQNALNNTREDLINHKYDYSGGSSVTYITYASGGVS